MFVNVVVRILGLNKDFNISIPKGMILRDAYDLISKILADETYGELKIDNNYKLVKISDGKVLNSTKTLNDQMVYNGETLLLV